MGQGVWIDMSKIVYAAGLLAKELHRGQMDKGCHDYFKSHLLKVASSGVDWKEKVVGFLHDASEDCDVTVEEVMEMLDAKVSRLVNGSKGNCREEEWWEDWMENIAPYPGELTHSITNEERKEIITSLSLLNHHTASTREEYIERISCNRLAVKVKMHDLENNMDITRIPEPTEKDFARIERYKAEYQKLLKTEA